MTVKDALTGSASRFKAGPEIWGLRLALVAAFCFMWMRSGAPTFGFEQVLAGLALGMAALVFEYIAAKKATLGWINRSPVALIGWGIVWAAAFAYAGNNWLGSASDGEAQKANVQKAAFVSYDDSRKDLSSAREREEQDRKSLHQLESMTWQPMPKIGNQTVMSAAAAKAIMEAAREGSSRYRQAEVAFLDLTERAKWQKNVETAKVQHKASLAALKDAETKASNTKVTTSESRTDLRFYVKYAGFSDDVAQDIQALLKIAVVSAFVTFSAVLATLDANKDVPRKPWINWRGWITRARRLWDGTDHTVVVNRMHSTHVIRTDKGLMPATFEHKPA